MDNYFRLHVHEDAQLLYLACLPKMGATRWLRFSLARYIARFILVHEDRKVIYPILHLIARPACMDAMLIIHFYIIYATHFSARRMFKIHV